MQRIKKLIAIAYGLTVIITLTAQQSASSSSSSSSFPSTTTHQNPPPRFLRAALFLESGISENIYCGSKAVLLDLITTLKEHTCPVIISGPVLHTLLFRIKNTPQKYISILKEMSDLEKKQSALEKKIEKTALELQLQITYLKRLNELKEEITKNKFEYIPKNVRTELSKILDNWANWHIYAIEDSMLYLMIPDEFFTAIKSTWNSYPYKPYKASLPILQSKLGISEQEIITGFKIDHPEIMQKITFDDLNKQLAASYEGIIAKTLATTKYSTHLSTRWNQPINVKKIKNIFVSSEKITSPLLGVWNIYITGHGQYSNEKYVRLFPLQNDPDAMIAGLSIDSFNELLAFFNNTLDTASVYYLTCFGGGHHQKIVERELTLLPQKKRGTIIITSGTLSDIAVTESAESLKTYFTEIENITSNLFIAKSSELYEKMLSRKISKIESATDHLDTIKKPENIRSIFVKSWKSKILLDSESRVFTITNALSVSTAPITITGKQAVILLTSTHISAPLIINTNESCDSTYYPVFISKPSEPTRHVFNEIDVINSCPLDTFIKKSLLSPDYAYQKTFLIKKIKGLTVSKDAAPIEIENLEIFADRKIRYTAKGITYECYDTICKCNDESCELNQDIPFNWYQLYTKSK